MFGKKKPKDIDSKTGVDYGKLGRAVESALIQDYIYLLHSTRRQIWSSFIRGLFAGFGGVVGASLVVAVLLALLHVLGGAPFIGHFVNNIANNIHTNNTPK